MRLAIVLVCLVQLCPEAFSQSLDVKSIERRFSFYRGVMSAAREFHPDSVVADPLWSLRIHAEDPMGQGAREWSASIPDFSETDLREALDGFVETQIDFEKALELAGAISEYPDRFSDEQKQRFFDIIGTEYRHRVQDRVLNGAKVSTAKPIAALALFAEQGPDLDGNGVPDVMAALQNLYVVLGASASSRSFPIAEEVVKELVALDVRLYKKDSAVLVTPEVARAVLIVPEKKTKVFGRSLPQDLQWQIKTYLMLFDAMIASDVPPLVTAAFKGLARMEAVLEREHPQYGFRPSGAYSFRNRNSLKWVDPEIRREIEKFIELQSTLRGFDQEWKRYKEKPADDLMVNLVAAFESLHTVDARTKSTREVDWLALADATQLMATERGGVAELWLALQIADRLAEIPEVHSPEGTRFSAYPGGPKRYHLARTFQKAVAQKIRVHYSESGITDPRVDGLVAKLSGPSPSGLKETWWVLWVWSLSQVSEAVGTERLVSQVEAFLDNDLRIRFAESRAPHLSPAEFYHPLLHELASSLTRALVHTPGLKFHSDRSGWPVVHDDCEVEPSECRRRLRLLNSVYRLIDAYPGLSDSLAFGLAVDFENRRYSEGLDFLTLGNAMVLGEAYRRPLIQPAGLDPRDRIHAYQSAFRFIDTCGVSAAMEDKITEMTDSIREAVEFLEESEGEDE